MGPRLLYINVNITGLQRIYVGAQRVQKYHSNLGWVFFAVVGPGKILKDKKEFVAMTAVINSQGKRRSLVDRTPGSYVSLP